MRNLLMATYYFLVGCTFFACSPTSPDEKSESSFVTNLKTLPNEYAKGFAILESGDYRLIHIFSPFQDAADTLKYLLLNENQSPPSNTNGYTIIKTPIKKMVLTSTTHIPLVEELEQSANIAAVSDPDFIFSKNIREAIENGEIQNAGSNGQLNLETILALNSDLVVSSAWSTAAYDAYNPLINASIPVLVNSEWTEPHPLGRLEWIKVFGHLLNQKEKAETFFTAQKEKYVALVDKVKAANLTKPSIIHGMPYQEAWSIAGGNSYIGQLLKDAGTTWHWAEDTSAVSLQLDFETVYEVGEKADFWIAPGRVRSMQEILAVDKRFGNFKSVKANTVFNYHKRINQIGMFDYYESGVVHPDMILADLVHIIHPEILPSHESFYFERVE